MSTPRRNNKGVWTLTVQYAGRRRNLTLGKLPKSQVYDFAHNANELIEHVKYGGKALPQRLQYWINHLSDRHKIQLSEIGLFDYHKGDLTVGDLMDKYAKDYENRADVSPSSKTKVKSTINNRLGRLRSVRLADVEPVQRSARQNAEPIWSDEAKQKLTDFNSWQRNHYAAATWTRDNKLFSSVGIWAVANGFCDHNPFVILPSASMINAERNTYLTAEMVRDAMDSCLSPDIRLTLALGRFAGLRTCSEVRTMKWSHVDTKAGTLTVIDSKKKAPRTMPLFDHVLVELERQENTPGTLAGSHPPKCDLPRAPPTTSKSAMR